MLRLDRAEGGADYLYTGDLWSSAPDGLKSHDLQASHNYIVFTRQRQIMCATRTTNSLSFDTQTNRTDLQSAGCDCVAAVLVPAPAVR